MRSIIADTSLSSARTVPHFESLMLAVIVGDLLSSQPVTTWNDRPLDVERHVAELVADEQLALGRLPHRGFQPALVAHALDPEGHAAMR